jgi:hypothetical protein
MSNRYDVLKKEITRRKDSETKRKLVKCLRKEIYNSGENDIIINSISVGWDNQGDIVALIDCHYQFAIRIKKILENNKILKYFDIRFNINETYPQGAVKDVK